MILTMKNHQHSPSKFRVWGFKRMSDFQNVFSFWICKQSTIFNRMIFTPKVSQIVHFTWCIAKGAATIVRNNGTSTHRALLLTIFPPRCSLRRIWVIQGSTIYLLQVMPIHPDSTQALWELGNGPIFASITPKQLITSPSQLSRCRLMAIVHYGDTSSHSLLKWRLHSY